MASPGTPPKPLTRVRAWTCVLVNQLATPGLGSYWAGRKRAGGGQVCLALAGFFFFLGWLFEYLRRVTLAAMDEPLPAGNGAWMAWSAVICFGVAWVWALFTSISLLRQAGREEASSAAGVPPLLAGAPPELAGAASETPPGGGCEIAPPHRNYAMPRLNPREIQAALAAVPQWRQVGNTITRTYQFKDFMAAMQFINAVARLAEAAWHHPDIDVRWNKVTLTLSTHSEGGLTEKDFNLAKQFDQAA